MLDIIENVSRGIRSGEILVLFWDPRIHQNDRLFQMLVMDEDV